MHVIGQNRSDLKHACVNKLEIYDKAAGIADYCGIHESPAGSLGIYLGK